MESTTDLAATVPPDAEGAGFPVAIPVKGVAASSNAASIPPADGFLRLKSQSLLTQLALTPYALRTPCPTLERTLLGSGHETMPNASAAESPLGSPILKSCQTRSQSLRSEAGRPTTTPRILSSISSGFQSLWVRHVGAWPVNSAGSPGMRSHAVTESAGMPAPSGVGGEPLGDGTASMARRGVQDGSGIGVGPFSRDDSRRTRIRAQGLGVIHPPVPISQASSRTEEACTASHSLSKSQPRIDREAPRTRCGEGTPEGHAPRCPSRRRLETFAVHALVPAPSANSSP